MIKLIPLINELEINNPNKNWKQVWAMYCFVRQDYEWGIIYDKIQIFKDKYNTDSILQGGGIPSFIIKLSQSDLNKLYNELKQFSQNKELNELQINNPRVTAEKVCEYFYNTLDKYSVHSNIFTKYIIICKSYCEKYGIIGWLSDNDFAYLSQSELNSVYREMQQLVQKYGGEELNELTINNPNKVFDLIINSEYEGIFHIYLYDSRSNKNEWSGFYRSENPDIIILEFSLYDMGDNLIENEGLLKFKEYCKKSNVKYNEYVQDEGLIYVEIKKDYINKIEYDEDFE